MGSRRNPISRQVAIVGVGSTEYVRAGGRKSRTRLATEAAIDAIRDAGIDRQEIDGICGSFQQASPQNIQEALGIKETTWFSSPTLPFSMMLTDAAHALFAGTCEMALIYQAQLRTVATSSSASAADPIRSQADPAKLIDQHQHIQYLVPYGRRVTSYGGYMQRYIHEFGVPREHFGYVALNSRAHAMSNPHAVLREPMTMDDYLAARFVRDPMCVLDMDYIVDGADAFVLTTAERARDLVERPVLIDTLTYGAQEHPEVDKYPSLAMNGQSIVAKTLWAKSDLTVDDVDAVFPYDGFTIIALKWLESFGFCDPGGGGHLLEASWDRERGYALINGRVPVNTHGGSLSEGASQGAGHLRGAVRQLRGCADGHQVEAPRSALIGIGGLFMNSTAVLLVND